MNKSSFYKIINNERGIAIGMVLTAVVILTTIMVNFSFETNINKIKAYNIEDRAKAKLTAESGIQFAMARLRLYKEAYNFLQKNESAQQLVKQDILNSIWNFPFIYPIPENANMNAIQKEAVSDFTESTIIEGSLQLTINNMSNKINLNMVRVSLSAQAEAELAATADPKNQSTQEDKETYGPDAQLLSTLRTSFENKIESDEFFAALYQGIEPQDLVNEVKYNLSDPDSVDSPPGIESNFQSQDLSAKKAPFMSMSEVYTLPTWSDDIVDLIKNEFTVHGAIMIDLNKITDKLLKLLIPQITDDDVAEFFKYKNDPEKPQFFNNLEDFKRYIVNIASLMSTNDFDDKFNKFLKQGLQFGPTPSLFEVISQSTVGRATYRIIAQVILPAQPEKIKEIKDPNRPESGDIPPIDPNKPQDPNTPEPPVEPEPNPNKNPDKKKQKTLLLEPRIVEIIVT